MCSVLKKYKCTLDLAASNRLKTVTISNYVIEGCANNNNNNSEKNEIVQ